MDIAAFLSCYMFHKNWPFFSEVVSGKMFENLIDVNPAKTVLDTWGFR